jgi:hypothetical protein
MQCCIVNSHSAEAGHKEPKGLLIVGLNSEYLLHALFLDTAPLQLSDMWICELRLLRQRLYRASQHEWGSCQGWF